MLLVNTDPDEDYQVERGDRIAQLVVQRVEQAAFVPVAALDATDRGTGGFGHTGALRTSGPGESVVVGVGLGQVLAQHDAQAVALDPPLVRRRVEHGRRDRGTAAAAAWLAVTGAVRPGSVSSMPTASAASSTSNVTVSVPSPSGSGASSAAASPTASWICSTSW